jgi:hypothetical protein
VMKQHAGLQNCGPCTIAQCGSPGKARDGTSQAGSAESGLE